MKVTEVKTFFVHAVRQNWLFVKVTTDTGLTGWGEASVEAQENAVEHQSRCNIKIHRQSR